jgi:hypothetical protein
VEEQEQEQEEEEEDCAAQWDRIGCRRVLIECLPVDCCLNTAQLELKQHHTAQSIVAPSARTLCAES